MKIEIQPTKNNARFKEVFFFLCTCIVFQIILNIEDEEESLYLFPKWLDLINEGCKVALYNGPILGYPVTNLNIYLK